MTRKILEMIYAMSFVTDGVSATLSPANFITSLAIDTTKHCVVPLDAYVQTHEQHDNPMSNWTIAAIGLRTTGNL